MFADRASVIRAANRHVTMFDGFLHFSLVGGALHAPPKPGDQFVRDMLNGFTNRAAVVSWGEHGEPNHHLAATRRLVHALGRDRERARVICSSRHE